MVGTVGAQDPTEIADWNDLDNVRNDLSGDYVLVNDLNESTAGYDTVAGPTANDGKGFEPIGNVSHIKFTGTFDGNNHTISGLNISRPTTDDVGLIGFVDDPGYVKNLRLEGVEIEGNDRVGALIGYSKVDTSNSFATGNVTGDNFVGGLVGSQQAGVLHNSSAAVRVQSDNGGSVGGLVGVMDGVVSDSHATGDVVTSVNKVGGLIGSADPAVVTNSYATGDVQGAGEVGGLVGYGRDNITDSYATGNVTGTDDTTVGYIGGLVGQLRDGTVNRSYASGNVSGEDNGVGGLVGYSYDGSIVASNATGNVEGRTNGAAGGLLGDNFGGSVNRSYATGAVNNTGTAGGLVGLNGDSSPSPSVYGNITASYATGSVEAGDVAGGLVGKNDAGDITSSYAVGSVSRATTIGGAVGENATGAIVDTYWDVTATGQTDGTGTGDDSGSVGLDTRDMKGDAAKTNMSAFDFVSTWNTTDDGTNISYPFLRANTQKPAPGIEEPGGGADSTIKGTVTDAEGDPVSGVTVNVVTDPGGTFVDVATTDADGNYSVAVSAGSYEVAVTDSDYEFFVEPGITVGESETAIVDIQLTQLDGTGFINGTVEDEVGNPIPSANVMAADSSFTNFGSDAADASGDFSMEVRAGTYSVRADATGYASKVLQDVEVTENETADVTISLEEPGYVNGTVTAANGDPASNAFVIIETDDGVFPAPVGQSTPGEYNVTVPPGEHTVSVFATNATVPASQVSVTAGEANETNFQLRNSTIVKQSVEKVDGPGDGSGLGIRAAVQSGFLQAQVVNESDFDQQTPGEPSELEGLGIDETTTLRMNITVTNFTANSLLWGIDDARWNTSQNETVQNGTDITITGSPATMQVNFNRPEVGPLISQDPSEVQWPTGTNDRATDGRNQTVYVGLFDLSSMPDEVQNNIRGMSVTTNAQTFSIPSVRNGALRVWVAAPTLTVDGADHDGFYQAEIPDSQLDEWGVSDPESELDALYKGSSADFTVTETDDGARIRIENIGFSAGYVEVKASSDTSGNDQNSETVSGGGGGSADDSGTARPAERIPREQIRNLVPDIPSEVEPERASQAQPVFNPEAGTSSVAFNDEDNTEELEFEGEINGEITTADLDREPDQTGPSPGRSVSVTQIKVPAGSENTPATVRMRVSTERLEEVDADAEDLRINRFNEAEGEWQSLDTEVVEITDERVRLAAQTPGFSFFSVSATSTPEAAITAPDSVGVGEEFTLDGSGSADEYGEIVSWEWSVDGEILEGKTVTTAIDTASDVTVELTVENNAGETDTESTTISIREVDDTDDTDADDTDADDTEPDPAADDTEDQDGFSVVIAVFALLTAALLARGRS